jgi:hypothetical protein
MDAESTLRYQRSGGRSASQQLGSHIPFDGIRLRADSATHLGLRMRRLLSAGRPRPGIPRPAGLRTFERHLLPGKLCRPDGLRRLHRASLHSMFARLTLWVHLRWLQLDHPMVSFQRLGFHILRRPSTLMALAPRQAVPPLKGLPSVVFRTATQAAWFLYPISYLQSPTSYIPSPAPTAHSAFGAPYPFTG